MFRPIFGSCKAVVLGSGFCVTKCITDIKAKGAYSEDLIKKRRFWPKGVPGELIGANFEDKQVVDIGIIQARNEDNKSFKIFCMKDPDYVMRIMVSWMTLDQFEGAMTRREFIDISEKKETKKFT